MQPIHLFIPVPFSLCMQTQKGTIESLFDFCGYSIKKQVKALFTLERRESATPGDMGCEPTLQVVRVHCKWCKKIHTWSIGFTRKSNMLPNVISPTLDFRADSRKIPRMLARSREMQIRLLCKSRKKAQGYKGTLVWGEVWENATRRKRRRWREGAKGSTRGQAHKVKGWNVFFKVPSGQKSRLEDRSGDVELLWGRKAAIETSYSNSCTLKEADTLLHNTFGKYIFVFTR